MINNKLNDKMNTRVCRCCLARPADKELKTLYTCFGKNEIYADMLKDCFEIHLAIDNLGLDSGICEVCINRLRDSFDFKHQVLKCQQEFQFTVKDVKKEITKVKEELADDGDDYYMFMTNESPPTMGADEKLAEMLGLKDITIKRKRKRRKDIQEDDCDDLPLQILSSKKESSNYSDNAKHVYNVGKILKYSNCTPFFNKTLSGIICAFCKTTSPGIKELRQHVGAQHPDAHPTDRRMHKTNISVKVDITDLRCTLCAKSVQNITALKKHISAEHGEKLFPDLYDYIFEFKLTDDDVLSCALCNSTFETFKMLLQHMNGHYRNYICDECDLGFINRHRLKNHKRIHEVGNFKCSFCDKVFGTPVRKKCHEKYTHNTSARYTTNCPGCEQTFNSYYQRNRHMAHAHNISAATYKCNVCDKSFILKSKLTSHIKKVHLMERNHTCPDCGQGFFIKQSLDEHMIRHNGERVFSCTVCHKAYARKKTLREHMRIHNNDRRFKCGLCGLAFVQKCSMKSHMLSNHGVALAEYESAAKAVGAEAD